MNFEILIEDLFFNIAADPNLTPIRNKNILSLLNDFEDKKWRYQEFESFIWDNIALTALSAQERDRLYENPHSKLVEAAKNLRITDNPDDVGQGSELAEIVLYGIMHHHYKALSVVPKIFYKQNVNDNAKGADSVHIVLDSDNKDFSLWFGEAKFYNNIEDSRLPEIISSVKNLLQTQKLKKENSIITNMPDIERLINDPDLASRVKEALSYKNSIDHIKPKIHVPILLLHECQLTAQASEMTYSYKNSVIDFHKERAGAYFRKQINSLSSKVTKYSEIKFHIILFPVPNRKQVIARFIRNATHYREE